MKKIIYLFLFAMLASFTVVGQTFVDQNASGSNDGSSWANAYTSLHDALDNTDSGEIWVASGTYTPGSDTTDFFSISSNIALYGGFAGTESAIGDRDIDANPTTLSGDLTGNDIPGNFDTNRDDNSTQILYVDSLLTTPIVIDGFTVSGGQGNTNNGAGGNDPRYLWTGGGIYALSTVAIDNCTFTMNAARSGGSVGVVNEGTAGSTIQNSTFFNNFSPSQAAGAFFLSTQNIIVTNCTFEDNETNRGALYPSFCSDILIDGCTFTNNNNNGGFGGAMFAWQPLNLTVTNCVFDGNSAGNAAGMYVDQRNVVEVGIDNVVFDNCDFIGNSTTDYGGTCIYFWNGNFTVTNSTFSGNTAPSSAPAIYMGGDEDEGIIDNCTFSDNQSNFAASIANYNGLSNLLISNTTFDGNRANSGGGALSGGFLARTTVENCIFNANEAGYGGAIFLQNDSTEMTVTNTVFTSNISISSNGGAIATNNSIPLTVDGCNFEINTSATTGGAIFVTEDTLDISVFDLRNTIFNFNIAETQGGALNINNASSTIESCAFLNNSAIDPGTGGAISINSSEGGVSPDVQTTIVNSSFADNVGALAEGIASWTDGIATSHLTLQNNIFANFFGLDYVIEDGAPTVESLGGNLSNYEDQADVFNHPMDVLGEDPMFTDITEYDLRLLDGSPCIDAGIAEGAPEFDIEGNPRVGAVDIGAYEYQMGVNTEDIPLFDRNQLHLFPNPVKDQAQIVMDNEWLGELQVRIVSMAGQEVQQYTINKVSQLQQFPIQVGQLSHGSYKVLINNGQTILAAHLVKL
jgi:predicted outer membrane repeat protein